MKAGEDIRDRESLCDRAQVFFIQYGESLCGYCRIMTPTEITRSRSHHANVAPRSNRVLAAGLFGYSISDGQMRSFKETEGYLRDIEQMPNFAPPSVSSFVAQYLASHIGKTHSAS
jgi:hypothetical protein